jgi:hypothetical protein
VRASFSRLFERLVLHPAGSDWFVRDEQGHTNPSMRAGALEAVMSIEMVVRETAIDGYDGLSPVLGLEPLP